MNTMKLGAFSAFILGIASAAVASSAYTTGFEASEGWSLGNAEQNGWTRNSNANQQGRIQSGVAKTGNQSLELRTLDTQTQQDTMQGVITSFASRTVAYAGESATVNKPRVHNQFRSSFWFRTPDARLPVTSLSLSDPSNYEDPYGGILEFNPGFSNYLPGDIENGSNRYASLALYEAQDDRLGYFDPSQGLLLELSTAQDFSGMKTWQFDILGQNLSYATWYRIAFDIKFVDGTNANETPNDILTVSLFDSTNALINSVTNSTWESPFRSAFGTGAYAINGMGFRGMRQTADLTLGYIDDFQVESVPEPMTMSVLALAAWWKARRRAKQAS